ncbi:hypothetical protein, partial [Bradyrhizobium ottawaense]|uniref:hypothetical protein n=1 Tax=Bradyrhizobium ottawaense TaxID=931866 RepID=UPI003B9F1918
SDNHASAWRLPYGCFSWCLDADERRRARPRTRPWTWKGRTCRSSRSAGSTAGGTTGHGPSGGAASHGTSRRPGVPSTGHAAATGHGAAPPGAPHRRTAVAAGPPLCCTTAASGPARGGAAT